MIDGRELVAIGPRFSDMALLHLGGPAVLFVRESFLRGSGTRSDTAAAAVIADVRIVHDNVRLIDVVNFAHIYIVDARVVVKAAVGPAASVVAGADVTETVVNAAIEADLRSPVARVPEIGAVRPAPVTRRPEHANRGRLNPGAGNPEVSAVIAVAPVAGRPDVTIAGANGLRVNGEHGGRDRHGKYDLR